MPEPDDLNYTEMTLRDYFAAKCMPVLIAGTTMSAARKPESNQKYAKAAYDWADALLKERGPKELETK